MSLAAGFNLRFNGVAPVLKKLLAEGDYSRLGRWAGTEAKKLTQSHLLRLGTNKRGWPSTHFWSRAAKATSFLASGKQVTVSINQQGVAQRYYGGRISAVNRRALTIPISPEASGRVASDFPNAFLLKTKKGAYLVQHGEEISTKSGKLVKRTGQGFARKRVSAFLEFLFKLVPYVDQQPNPNVLPGDADLADAVWRGIETNLRARAGI